MAFRVAPVTGGQAEMDGHKLEVAYAKIKIRQLVDKENAAIGANPLSNSMVGGFGGSTGMSNGAGGGGGSVGSTFGNPKHESVFKMLQACSREEGLHRDEVVKGLNGRLTKKEVDDALAYLSDEGATVAVSHALSGIFFMKLFIFPRRPHLCYNGRGPLQNDRRLNTNTAKLSLCRSIFPKTYLCSTLFEKYAWLKI